MSSKRTAGTVHIVFGPQGAGKTTYARHLSAEIAAVCFSIDDWMHGLYGPDLPVPLDFRWVMERVRRCEAQIWAVASEIAMLGGDVVLDIGFMKEASRAEFVERARSHDLPSQLHVVDASHDVRRARVLSRNAEKGDTFAFEVTPATFDFMEQQFQRPTDAELPAAILSTS